MAFSVAGFVDPAACVDDEHRDRATGVLTTGLVWTGQLAHQGDDGAGLPMTPLWRRATDRVGQARVLLVMVLINILSVALLVTRSISLAARAVSLAAAVGVGLVSAWRISGTRARWTLG